MVTKLKKYKQLISFENLIKKCFQNGPKMVPKSLHLGALRDLLGCNFCIFYARAPKAPTKHTKSTPKAPQKHPQSTPKAPPKHPQSTLKAPQEHPKSKPFKTHHIQKATEA